MSSIARPAPRPLARARRGTSLSSLRYGVTTAVYEIVGWTFGIPVLASLLCALRVPAAWPLLPACAATAFGAGFWISRYQLIFGPTELHYRAPLAAVRSVPYAAIRSVDTVLLTGSFGNTVTIVIRTADGAAVRMNPRVFSGEAMQRLGALAPRTHHTG